MSDLDACNEMADTLYSQKERYKSISILKSKEIAISDSLIANYKGQIAEKIIIGDSYKKEAKKNGTKVKWLKGFATGFGIVAVVEAGFIWLVLQIK